MKIDEAMRAAFASARETRDVACIETFFTQPKVVLQVARLLASITRLDDAVSSHPRFARQLRRTLRDAVEHDQYEVLEWFCAAERVDTMGVVLAHYLSELVEPAIVFGGLGILSVILSSPVWVDKIADADKPGLLAEWVVASAERGVMKMADMLVAHGASVQLAEDELRRRIYSGGAKGTEAVCVEALVHHGVSFVGADANLSDVIQRSDKEVAKVLVAKGVDVNAAALGAALHAAVQDAEIELVKNLLTLTCFDVDFVNQTGQSALMMVTQLSYSELGAYSDHPAEITRLLLAYGADVNLQNVCGLTPLHYACRSDLFEVVRVLLENGADPMARSNSGECPHDEISVDDIEFEAISAIMDLLLEHGAELDAKNERGDSMFDRLSKSAAGQTYIESRSQVIAANALK